MMNTFHAIQKFLWILKMSKAKSQAYADGVRLKRLAQLFFLCYLILSSSYIKAELSCQRSGSTTPLAASSVSETLEGVCDFATSAGCVGYVSGLNMSEQLTFAAAGQCYRNCGSGPSFVGAFIVACQVDGPTYFLDGNGLNAERNSYGVQNNSSCNPINLATGNKYKIHTDISPEIEGSPLQKPAFTRTYNSSLVVNQSKRVEKSWRHTYQRKMEFIEIYLPAVNYIGRTDALAIISANKQSSIYVTKQQACELGFAEIVSKSTGFSRKFLSAAPVFIRDRCILQDDRGRYITEIPIKSSVSVSLDPKRVPFYSYKVKLYRPDGNVYSFVLSDTSVPSQHIFTIQTSGVNAALVRNVDTSVLNSFGGDTINYIYTDASEVKEIYSIDGVLQSISYPNGIVETLQYDEASGLLSQVINNFGHSIQFTYNALNQIESVTEGDRVWLYVYNTEGLLEKVTNPDLTEKNYQYISTPQGTLLAGLIDERNIRYSTFDYYDDGLAKSSYLGDSLSRIENTSVQYNAGANTVTDSRGNQTTLQISTAAVKGLVTQVDSGACPTCVSKDATYNYDTNLVNPFQSKLNILDKTEFDVLTTYNSYDNNHNPTSITEAVNTPQEKTTTYTYDPRGKSNVTLITELSVFSGSFKTTNYTYDDFANITNISINGFAPDGTPVSRNANFKYAGPFNQISEYDGPRNDVNDIVLFEYYDNDAAQGNNRARLKSVRTFDNVYYQNNITYTATGKIAREERANNLVITYFYYAGNDRLSLVRQADSISGDAQMTRWTYLPTGEVATITQGAFSANPVTLTLTYDDARRLTRITDALGNYIEYVLDSEGNVENENVYDAAGTLTKALTQTFDTYNRLDTATQLNENQTVNFNPDGTIGTVTDGKNVVNQYSYDSLKRLVSINQDQGGVNPATANALNQFGYDVHNNLTSVTDANNAQTVYVYDDLGNLINQTSPDTGSVTYSHDLAGNIKSATDAKGQLFSYTYDSQNRLTNIDALGTEDDVSYVYDSCSQGVGKLCQSVRNNSTLNYRYTGFGDVAGVDQSLVTWDGYNQADNTLNYAYDATGNINQITYPSGALVNYTYNAAGKIDNVSLDQNGVVTSLSLNIAYLPFGAETIQTYGNTLEILGYYDEAYRSIIIGDSLLYFDYQRSYDENGNTLSSLNFTENGYVTQGYSYDEHQRLTESNGFSGNYAYAYDKVGNRTNKTQDTIETSSVYQPNTNRLSSLGGETIVTDANGNISNVRGMALTFTTDNRLKSVNADAEFEYNGNGERSIKHSRVRYGFAGANGVTQSTSYLYGLNGELIAEVGPTGAVKKEYIYLNGKPLAMLDHQPSSNKLILNADIDGDGEVSVEDYLVWWLNHRNDPAYEVTGDGVLDDADSNAVLGCVLRQGRCVASSYSTDIYYIHNDHLGTPKMLTNSNGQPVWRASAAPFGQAVVNDDVDGDGVAVEFNIRQPGQYFDVESGFYYNYFRYYDPETGRYVTSDPIGLDGGVNTYAYVGNNPLNYTDPYGLFIVNPVTVNLARMGLQGAIGLAGAWGLYNSSGDYPANPDDWNPPDGWSETPAGEKTGGKHRQWNGPDGKSRRWDREGRKGGKDRGPHWHDSDRPGDHIEPDQCE